MSPLDETFAAIVAILGIVNLVLAFEARRLGMRRWQLSVVIGTVCTVFGAGLLHHAGRL